MDFLRLILKLTDRFYPSGRAFKIFTGSWKEAFYTGISKSENRAYIDALGIFNSILPDNDLFSVEDAFLWERRYGIFGNENSTLEERKLALIRKINHPGEAKARQHFLYIQGQLQKAGFDVFIHENIFQPGNFAKNPAEVLGNFGRAVHSVDVQHGQIQHGSSNLKLIVNSVDQKVDDTFVLSDNFRNVFFIGGEILGDPANISANREIEFRNLILNLKPVQNVGILIINYI